MPDHNTASAAIPAPALIDIGINLTHDSYDADRDAVLARAREAGVVQMVVTGATLASSAQAIALARQHPGRLFATAGVHPHYAAELDSARLAELAELVQRPEVVAVGECGLDYFRDLAPRPAQRAAFQRHALQFRSHNLPQDELSRGIQPAIQINCRQDGFERVHQQRRFSPAAAFFFPAAQPQIVTQFQLLRHLYQMPLTY